MRGWSRLLRSVAGDMAVILVIWYVISAAVGQARVVPTSSMEPTILPGDRLWTDKVTLRFRPVTRGDIVIFTPPVPSQSPYVKRVIGLPGETVQVRDGRVWVNGIPLAEPYLAELPMYAYGPVTVGPDEYFVLGDNRNGSNDSHQWGLLPRRSITALAVLRYWPLDRFGSIK